MRVPRWIVLGGVAVAAVVASLTLGPRLFPEAARAFALLGGVLGLALLAIFSALAMKFNEEQAARRWNRGIPDEDDDAPGSRSAEEDATAQRAAEKRS